MNSALCKIIAAAAVCTVPFSSLAKPSFTTEAPPVGIRALEACNSAQHQMADAVKAGRELNISIATGNDLLIFESDVQRRQLVLAKIVGLSTRLAQYQTTFKAAQATAIFACHY